jgi:acid phosphatase (class A)
MWGKRTSLAVAAVLLAAAPCYSAPTGGFLDDQDLKFTAWGPPTPTPTGAVEAADLGVYLETRAAVAGQRGAVAHLDDVYRPAEVAPRFAEALGTTLTADNAKVILNTIHLAQLDLEALVKPVKVAVADGGRVRPYVQFPALPACPHTVDDTQYQLNTSGSYPSTHAAVGMLWALILSQLAPDKTDALFSKGYAFGESRLVCGFHYPSDLAAGRLAATVLIARLQTNKAFQDQMTAARVELDTLRGVGPTKTTPLLERIRKREAKRVLPPLSVTQ